MTTQSLWRLLAAVRRFQITVLPPTDTCLQPRHRGQGAIQAAVSTAPGASTIVWQESGRWVLGSLANIPFRNITAWRLDGGSPALHLSHLRRGNQHPTFLATLRPRPSGIWAAAEPHACGPDVYLPTLAGSSEGVRLEWEVRSPTDPYRLRFEAWPADA